MSLLDGTAPSESGREDAPLCWGDHRAQCWHSPSSQRPCLPEEGAEHGPLPRHVRCEHSAPTGLALPLTSSAQAVKNPHIAEGGGEATWSPWREGGDQGALSAAPPQSARHLVVSPCPPISPSGRNPCFFPGVKPPLS